MSIANIIAELDEELEKLKQAKAILANGDRNGKTPRRIPARSNGKVTAKKVHRVLTPEGRAKIAEAVNRRWALQKRQARQGEEGSAAPDGV